MVSMVAAKRAPKVMTGLPVSPLASPRFWISAMRNRIWVSIHCTPFTTRSSICSDKFWVLALRLASMACCHRDATPPLAPTAPVMARRRSGAEAGTAAGASLAKTIGTATVFFVLLAPGCVVSRDKRAPAAANR